jgi:type III secretion protein D
MSRIDSPLVADDLSEAVTACEPDKQAECRTLELRILSGLHAGARAPLAGSEYTLGTLDDCDFVLTDAGVQPRHARLSRGTQGWQLDCVAEDGQAPGFAPVRLEPGKAVPIGPIVLVLDEPQAPWPTLEQLVLVPHANALAPVLPPPPPPQPALPRQRGASAAMGTMARRAVAAAMAVATAGLSALAFVAWADGRKHDPAAQIVVAAEAPRMPASPDPGRRLAIEAVLKKLDLAARSRVEEASGGWRVSAAVADDAESESLAAALSRLQPAPALRIVAEQDVRDGLAELLSRTTPDASGSVSARHVGHGRYRVEGRLGGPAARDRLLRDLAEAFPVVREWDNAVLTGGEAGDRLVAELREQGWQIASRQEGSVVNMEVALQPRDEPRWQRALMAAVRRHAVRFNARLAFVQPAAQASGAPARLPFEIRSVVGGDMPYVLLSGGERLGQGGIWQGWRFAGLEGQQAVFENGAQRATVPR